MLLHLITWYKVSKHKLMLIPYILYILIDALLIVNIPVVPVRHPSVHSYYSTYLRGILLISLLGK